MKSYRKQEQGEQNMKLGGGNRQVINIPTGSSDEKYLGVMQFVSLMAGICKAANQVTTYIFLGSYVLYLQE